MLTDWPAEEKASCVVCYWHEQLAATLQRSPWRSSGFDRVLKLSVWNAVWPGRNVSDRLDRHIRQRADAKRAVICSAVGRNRTRQFATVGHCRKNTAGDCAIAGSTVCFRCSLVELMFGSKIASKFWKKRYLLRELFVKRWVQGIYGNACTSLAFLWEIWTKLNL